MERKAWEGYSLSFQTRIASFVVRDQIRVIKSVVIRLKSFTSVQRVVDRISSLDTVPLSRSAVRFLDNER